MLARLEAEGLNPSPEASKERLIRRVTLDLTGLPPTLTDIDAFLTDRRPDAYERLVDRLSHRPGSASVWPLTRWMSRDTPTHDRYQADVYRAMWP